MAMEVKDAVCGHVPEAHVASGECVGGDPIGGIEGLALQVGEAKTESWCFDSGASNDVSFSSDKMTNFRPCNKVLRVANGAHLPIEGHGNLVVEFQSGQGSVRMELFNVAYVPALSYHLLSLPMAVAQGHTYTGDEKGITVHMKSGEELLVPLVGKMHFSYGYRLGSDEQACAVIAPGLMPTTDVDSNAYHRAAAHTHPRLMRESAKQQGIKLKPGVKLLPCFGCSAAKGISAPVKKTTENRSDKKLGRVFVDLSGKKPVMSRGGKQYAIIFRDDKTRMTWEYYLRRKSDAPEGLEQFLADIRDVGIPEIISSDDASELKGGLFSDICRKLRIKREFTSADTPQYNGVAERGLTLIEKVAKASTIQAPVTFVGMQLPMTGSLWPESHNYACDVLNRTATTSNPGKKSPYEMWYGKKPPPTLLEWLQPCFLRVKRKRKTDAQAKQGFYLGPAANHPRDCMRIYSKDTGQVILSRNVTWHHATPSSAQQTLPSPNVGGEGTSRPGGGGDDASDSDSDDDLDVTWVGDSFGAAGDVDTAAGAKPETVESLGGSIRGGNSGTPSTATESLGGSFGGGERNAPSTNSSSLPSRAMMSTSPPRGALKLRARILQPWARSQSTATRSP